VSLSGFLPHFSSIPVKRAPSHKMEGTAPSVSRRSCDRRSTTASTERCPPFSDEKTPGISGRLEARSAHPAAEDGDLHAVWQGTGPSDGCRGVTLSGFLPHFSRFPVKRAPPHKMEGTAPSVPRRSCDRRSTTASTERYPPFSDGKTLGLSRRPEARSAHPAAED
jgi:hypothetical protein